MLKTLQTHPGQLVYMPCGDGQIIAAPEVAGRIFAQIDGFLLHRLDVARLQNPVPNEFNNLGGNSLWPAPEGGAFAYNYHPKTNQWYVQDAIATAPCRISAHDDSHIIIEKEIALRNRKGREIRLRFTRRIDTLSGGGFSGLLYTGYKTRDIFTPLGKFSVKDFLLAPWSLEQFPGTDGVTFFVKVGDEANAINLDYYGQPEKAPRIENGILYLELSRRVKFQAGFPVVGKPEFIGAYDANRNLVTIRTAEVAPGKYFNMADNDQPRGPWTAADMYSVFNGGELDFHELETLGAMPEENGFLAESVLHSQTRFWRGEATDLKKMLKNNYGVKIE
jgi:hypothetical protein